MYEIFLIRGAFCTGTTSDTLSICLLQSCPNAGKYIDIEGSTGMRGVLQVEKNPAQGAGI